MQQYMLNNSLTILQPIQQANQANTPKILEEKATLETLFGKNSSNINTNDFAWDLDAIQLVIFLGRTSLICTTSPRDN